MEITWANNPNGVNCKYERPAPTADAQYARDCYRYQIRNLLPKEAPKGASVRYE